VYEYEVDGTRVYDPLKWDNLFTDAFTKPWEDFSLAEPEERFMPIIVQIYTVIIILYFIS
jgi:hypothetical protein